MLQIELLSSSDKNVFHVLTCFGRGLAVVSETVLFQIFISLLVLDLPLTLVVDLVANQIHKAIVGVLPNFFLPLFDVDEGVSLGNVVDHEDAVSAPVEDLVQSFE